MNIVGGLSVQMRVPVLVDGETVAGRGVISRSPSGHISVMFGPVLTYSNNTEI